MSRKNIILLAVMACLSRTVGIVSAALEYLHQGKLIDTIQSMNPE